MQSRFILSTLLVSSLLVGCQTIPEQNSTASLNGSTGSSAVKTAYNTQQLISSSQKTESNSPDDLWKLTRQHLQLDYAAEHESVNAEIEWYSNYPAHMRKITQNATRYYHYVLNEVLERGFPAEIALLPIVESSYNPQAYSSGHAAGIWQFIPSTAKYRGLKKNRWYDGRKDIIDSTDVALDYLEHLNNRFDGDWLLTMAAYNAGGGTVSKAVRKNRESGKPTDFWSLTLPKETRRYVPRILAIASFVRSPEKYRMDLPPIENQPYFDIVKTEGQINLAQAANISGVDLDEIQQLNPGILGKISAPTGPYRLLVPEQNAEQFRDAVASLIKPNANWAEYKIQRGDSLSTLAEQFETPMSVIKNANQLSSNELRAGKTLLIPQTASPANSFAKTTIQQKKQNSIYQHRVKAGDTLWRIAQIHEVNIASLTRWNNISSRETLRAGKILRIGELPENLTQDEANALQQIGYKVRSGDSLYVIAQRYNINVADIREWNNLSSDNTVIKPGQQLTLFITES